MLGDAGEHLAQVRLRVDAVEFGGTDQTVERGGAFAPGVRSGEEIVFSPEGHRTQGAFSGRVVDLDASVFAVARQRRPAGERVADCASELGLLGGLAKRGLKPLAQLLQSRHGVLLASRATLGG